MKKGIHDFESFISQKISQAEATARREEIELEKYITVGVLGGAYILGKKDQSMLTHAVKERYRGGGKGYSLCGKIKADNLCDHKYQEAPTCKQCLRLITLITKENNN